MGVQIITTPAGEEMVVMPRAEYDALVDAAQEAFEDGADAAAYAHAYATMKPEDLLPPEVSAAILKGKGRLRALREWRGESAAALATASGVAQAELESVEAGRKLLARDAAARLAEALSVPTNWLAD